MPESAIEISGLSIKYPIGFRQAGLIAVDGLSFSIPAGEIFGLLGPNGAGKTTTLKSILGFIRPDAGDIRISGLDSRDVLSHARLGFLPEQPYFYTYQTVEGALDFYGKLFNLPKETRREKTGMLLDLVNLSGHRKMLLKKLSKGMLQRVGVAQALLNDPDILILDEPASGLDPLGQIEMRDLILSLGGSGKTILLSSHQLAEVEKICDHVAIIDKGRLLASGATSELTGKGKSYTLKVKPANETASAALKKTAFDIAETRGVLSLKLSQENLAKALDILKSGKHEIISLLPVERSLEDLFLQLTGGKK